MPRNIRTVTATILLTLGILLIIGRPVVKVPVTPDDLIRIPDPLPSAGFARCTPPVGFAPVSSVEDLRGLDSIHGTNGNYFLCNDIDLGKSDTTNWAPIRAFAGIFEGNKHSIVNLKILGDDEGQGLFESVWGGHVQNLRIENASVQAGSFSGIVAGRFSQATLENVTIQGEVACSQGRCGLAVGSMIGTASHITASGDVTGPYVRGDFNNESGPFGCLFGEVVESIISDVSCLSLSNGITGQKSVGGITGRMENSVLERSRFEGKLTGVSEVGGLVGTFTRAEPYRDSLILESAASISGENPVSQLVGRSGAWEAPNAGTIRNSYLSVLVPHSDPVDLFMVGTVATAPVIEKSYAIARRVPENNIGNPIEAVLCSSGPCQRLPAEALERMDTFANAGWSISEIDNPAFSTWKIDPSNPPMLAWEMGMFMTPVPELPAPATLGPPTPRPFTPTPGINTPPPVLSPIWKPTRTPVSRKTVASISDNPTAGMQ